MRIAFLLVALVTASAQTKTPVPQSEWGKWETTASSSISPDGKWLAYRIQRSNGNHELRISGLAGGKNQTAAFGDAAAFSADSQWLAYSIGIHEDEEEKLKKDKKPIRRKLGLMRLATGEASTVANIESFAFAKSGSYLAMKHYGPEKPPPPPGETPQDAFGTMLTVRDLVSAWEPSHGRIKALCSPSPSVTKGRPATAYRSSMQPAALRVCWNRRLHSTQDSYGAKTPPILPPFAFIPTTRKTTIPPSHWPFEMPRTRSSTTPPGMGSSRPGSES
jgi:hypothetical protein